jgi:hypothetical protein
MNEVVVERDAGIYEQTGKVLLSTNLKDVIVLRVAAQQSSCRINQLALRFSIGKLRRIQK